MSRNVNANYSADSIQSLEILEAMRTKLGMYFNSSGNAALHHGLKEIISNSIDEAQQGYGNKIIIKFSNDFKTVCVRDFGRGIPFEKITEVCTVPHSSGKLRTGESAYEASGGLNGIGNKILTATGELTVKSFRNSKVAGGKYTYKTIEEFKIQPTTEPNGTVVQWKPDAEPFNGENTFSLSKVEEMVESMLYFLPNLQIELQGKLLTKKSIEDFFADYLDEEKHITKVFSGSYSCGSTKVKLGLVWNSKANLEESGVNLIPTPEGGTHITAFKTTLTREFNKTFSTSFSGDLIRQNLNLILGISSPTELVFSGQGKTKLQMPELNPDLNECYKLAINEMFAKDKQGFGKLVKALTKLEKNADLEKVMKSVVSKPKTAFSNLTDKYTGCRRTSNIELSISEGQSSAGSLKLGRADNQAIYAIRGKFKNTFDLEPEEVLKNAEVAELMSILGSPTSACKIYDKILLATDADDDGIQISLLLLGFLARFYKELILQGKVYFVKTPLFVGRKGENIKFAFTEEERDQKLIGMDISRIKGLGKRICPII